MPFADGILILDVLPGNVVEGLGPVRGSHAIDLSHDETQLRRGLEPPLGPEGLGHEGAVGASVDVFDELQRLFGRPILCIVPTPIIAELRLLRLDAKPSFKKEIDFALGLTERCKVINENVEPGETVDDALLRIALETGYPVATNDADLRQRLREVRIPVVYLRQRAFLEIDGCI